jgi:hypothetical protein
MWGSSCAIILRGHSSRVGSANYGSIPVDFDCERTSIASLKQNVIEPLQSVYEKVHVYCCPSVPDMKRDYLMAELAPWLKVYKECVGGDQLSNICNSLTSIPFKDAPEDCRYDSVFFTRFDLLYKKPITEWGIKLDSCDVCYPFKHVNWQEGSCYEVPDTMIWINNKQGQFFRFVERIYCMLGACAGYRYGESLHGIYKLLEEGGLKQCFMCDEIHATNTATTDWWACNPFYAHSGRHYYYNDFTSPCFLK